VEAPRRRAGLTPVKHEVAVRQFQIVHDAGGLEVRVALDAAAKLKLIVAR
jgi:hypothetical protein